jgi:hypothetical protein
VVARVIAPDNVRQQVEAPSGASNVRCAARNSGREKETEDIAHTHANPRPSENRERQPSAFSGD